MGLSHLLLPRALALALLCFVIFFGFRFSKCVCAPSIFDAHIRVCFGLWDIYIESGHFAKDFALCALIMKEPTLGVKAAYGRMTPHLGSFYSINQNASRFRKMLPRAEVRWRRFALDGGA